MRLATTVGGWRGSLETALPLVVFVVVNGVTGAMRTAAVAALAVAALLGLARLVQRQSLRFVLSSLFATAIAAWFALRSGRAEDAFLPGMLVSLGYGIGALVSILTRYPVVGFLVAAGDPDFAEDPMKWRRDPGMVTVSTRLTWVLVGLFAVRLAIQIPLYLAGATGALAVAKVVLGWPLWAAALSVMGAMLLRGHTPVTPEYGGPSLPPATPGGPDPAQS